MTEICKSLPVLVLLSLNGSKQLCWIFPWSSLAVWLSLALMSLNESGENTAHPYLEPQLMNLIVKEGSTKYWNVQTIPTNSCFTNIYCINLIIRTRRLVIHLRSPLLWINE